MLISLLNPPPFPRYYHHPPVCTAQHPLCYYHSYTNRHSHCIPNCHLYAQHNTHSITITVTHPPFPHFPTSQLYAQHNTHSVTITVTPPPFLLYFKYYSIFSGFGISVILHPAPPQVSERGTISRYIKNTGKMKYPERTWNLTYDSLPTGNHNLLRGGNCKRVTALAELTVSGVGGAWIFRF
jgi:hypothetical protein